MHVLVTAASRHGSTTEIAEALASALEDRGLEVAVLPPEQVGDLSTYDAVVLGSGVYLGHWLPPALALAHRITRSSHPPVWLFSSGPVGDPAKSMVKKMGVDPAELASLMDSTGAVEHRLLPGKLDRHHVHGVQRLALAMFRSLQGDFRDWPATREWAGTIADRLLTEAA